MSRIDRRARIALLFVFALVLAACSNAALSGPQVINMTLQEFGFQPSTITVKVGQPVKIVLKNNGTVTHDFSSTDAMVTVMNSQGAMHDMDNMNLMMHVAVEAGQSGSIEFTPTQAGTYTFFCTVAGHKDAGMMGKLVVTP
jgi:uncharacterized cupredoxin-like copper-binding protein